MNVHKIKNRRCPIATGNRARSSPWGGPVRPGIVVTAIVTICAVLAGCGPNTRSSQDAAGNDRQSLVVGVRNLQAMSAPIYWAEAKGYFDDAGVDLELIVGEAAQTSQLVSGQIDLFWSGPQGSLFGIINSGKTVHTIYGTDAGSNGYVVTSNDAVQTPADCTTMTTAPPGTVMHAYTRQMERIYDASWQLTQLTTIPAILANVVAGRSDCAMGNIAYYQSAIDDGKLRLIVDPGDPSTLPPNWPSFGVEAVVGGLPETLDRKRSTIETVLKAYNAALRDFRSTDSREIAETLLDSDPGWMAAGPADAIATALEEFKQFLSPDNGFISEEVWATTVAFFTTGGLDFLGTDTSRFDYENAVDMTFFESAIGQE